MTRSLGERDATRAGAPPRSCKFDVSNRWQGEYNRLLQGAIVSMRVDLRACPGDAVLRTCSH
jgi:hypothetical protein